MLTSQKLKTPVTLLESNNLFIYIYFFRISSNNTEILLTLDLFLYQITIEIPFYWIKTFMQNKIKLEFMNDQKLI